MINLNKIILLLLVCFASFAIAAVSDAVKISNLQLEIEGLQAALTAEQNHYRDLSEKMIAEEEVTKELKKQLAEEQKHHNDLSEKLIVEKEKSAALEAKVMELEQNLAALSGEASSSSSAKASSSRKPSELGLYKLEAHNGLKEVREISHPKDKTSDKIKDDSMSWPIIIGFSVLAVIALGAVVIGYNKFSQTASEL